MLDLALASSFWLLFLIIVGVVCGGLVCLSKSAVHSALNLILLYFISACLVFSLGYEFIGFIFVILYVGAIAVLFLFVVMTVDIRVSDLNNVWVSQYLFLVFFYLFGLFFSFKFVDFLEDTSSMSFVITFFAFVPHFLGVGVDGVFWFDFIFGVTMNIYGLGLLIYQSYALAFILASFILLVAMVSVIVLTMYHSGDVKRQDVYTQAVRNRYSSYYRTNFSMYLFKDRVTA